MAITTVLLFFAGLFLLIGGAELLVRGASRLASLLGISPLIIGLTVVAFGTSAPELAISIQSVISGQANIALGNVIGSNIFNILFILGISALITPLFISSQLLRFDIPLLIILSIGALLLSMDQVLSISDGVILISGMAVYLGTLIWMSRKDRMEKPPQQSRVLTQNPVWRDHWIVQIIYFVVGLALLIKGSDWFVGSAVEIAGFFGISELVIGITIVAAGTSMPEVVTSIVAAVKGQRDIAIGNVIGSNIFNILSVLGITTLFAPGGIPVSEISLALDLPVMVAVTLVCLPILFSGAKIDRIEGGILLLYYIAYTAYLVLHALQHRILSVYTDFMFYAFLPVSIIVIIWIIIRDLISEHKMN